jgi:hypothetical protein
MHVFVDLKFNASEKIKDFKKEGNVVYLQHD